jgi:3'-phosphoadenosine 5'-phosphosulfate (PAPS) 3'-phosphatase
LIESGRPVAGAIYAPLLEQLWFADTESYTVQIAPATPLATAAETRRITVRSPPPTGLVALVSRSHPDPATVTYLDGLPVVEQRPLGSSLKFCLIAQGEADLYPRLGPTCEWDTAAGHAVLAAAGGSVAAPDGRPLRYGKAAAGFRHQGFIACGGFQLDDGHIQVRR